MNMSNGKFLGTFVRAHAMDPLKSFRFRVDFTGLNDVTLGFMKVSGLKAQTDVVEYRDGGMNWTPQKSPGLTKFPNVTLERGQLLTRGGNAMRTELLSWYEAVFSANSPPAIEDSPNTPLRREVNIRQLNHAGRIVSTWVLQEAWITEYAPFGDLEALASANTIEQIVLAHEGFVRAINITQ